MTEPLKAEQEWFRFLSSPLAGSGFLKRRYHLADRFRDREVFRKGQGVSPVDSLKNVTERDRWKEVEVWVW
jgi:hypothetical protein